LTAQKGKSPFDIVRNRRFTPTMYVLSCEPATCAVPEWHKDLFRGHEETVTSREGWAPGSLNLAQAFATRLRALLAHGDITRLLIDFSKDAADPERFSRFSKTLNEDQRRKLDERHHGPYLKLLEQRAAEEIRRGGTALHLSIRTDDRAGRSTVALLHDPSRDLESTFVRNWAGTMNTMSPDLAVSLELDPNYPLSAALRRTFPDGFGSVSLVVAESCFLAGSPLRWDALKKILLDSLPKS
jgi:predicted N-formylglutamate amidohydrolase